MSKKFLHLVFVITLFAACKNESGNFTVTGKIKHAPSDTVYLERLSYNSGDRKIIDSAKLDKEGNYKLNGIDTQQNLYVLSFAKNPMVVVVNDGSKITVNFDLNGFTYPDINGSAATSELYTFIKNFWQKDSVLSESYYQLDSMGKEGMKDSAYAMQLQQKYTKELGSLGELIKNSLKKSNNPAAICFMLDKARNAISPDELNVMATDALKRFPAHSGLAIFKSAIAQSMQQSEQNGESAQLLNQLAPDLTMQDINGKNVSISDFKGKYLLVDFWASWCGPCRQENPNVVAAYNKFKDKNFTILGVSLDESKEDWLDAIKHDNLSWTQMSDLKHWESAAISVYRFDGIPFNVLIDPQGKIIAEGLRGQMLEQKLNEVLQ